MCLLLLKWQAALSPSLEAKTISPPQSFPPIYAPLSVQPNLCNLTQFKNAPLFITVTPENSQVRLPPVGVKSFQGIGSLEPTERELVKEELFGLGRNLTSIGEENVKVLIFFFFF